MPESPQSYFTRKCQVFILVIILVVGATILWSACSKSIHEMNGRPMPRKTTTFLRGILGNFEPTDVSPISGPSGGEGGKPHLLRSDQNFSARFSQSTYGMNTIRSDEISPDRFIPDFRHPECKHWHYPEKLPNASVVIVFHNGVFSTLMRTVHSVIDRTPTQFLREILLVDDCSDEENLQTKIKSYIQRWDGKVRLIRNHQREGMIKSTNRGAQEAHGNVVVILDAHSEVNRNWLPPLLAPIYKDGMTMSVPFIDQIDNSNFEVRPVDREGRRFRGIFDWGLHYKEKELPKMHIYRFKTQPYRSPTHPGGIFAIEREYFLELGSYDPGLQESGGENLELSFKIWMCGGNIVWVPCSRVARVYKSMLPDESQTLVREAEAISKLISRKRVVETWMDLKFKEYFYTREPLAGYLNMGDIRQQLKLKRYLNKKFGCKSFQWFMDKVANDVWDEFPEPMPNVQWGRMKNEATQYCLGKLNWDPLTRISVLNCSQGFTSDQLVRLNVHGQLGIGDRCVEADSNGVFLKSCSRWSNSGPWQYKQQINVMLHMLDMKCLAVNNGTLQLELLTCDPVSKYVQWEFVDIVL